MGDLSKLCLLLCALVLVGCGRPIYERKHAGIKKCMVSVGDRADALTYCDKRWYEYD